MLTFGGFLWLLVFWWLLARGFGWSCSGRRRQVYRQHPGYWQRPGRITRV
jgi:hypothetical protein